MQILHNFKLVGLISCKLCYAIDTALQLQLVIRPSMSVPCERCCFTRITSRGGGGTPASAGSELPKTGADVGGPRNEDHFHDAF